MSSMCASRAILVLTAVIGVMSRPLAGQTAQRSALEGLVTDPDGAIIPGATVRLVGTQLIGGPRVAKTDSTGRYRFGDLLPGLYDITASAKGLQTTERQGIRLPVETTYTVNLLLSIPGVAEQVDVRAERALIDTKSAAIPARFDQPLLHDLPTDRTLQGILSLAPGVTTTPPLQGYVGQVSFGGTQGSNGFTVDGVNLTESSLGDQWTGVHYNWIQEAQVVALGAPAEYGTFTGAIVDAVLRSGSNRVTGMGELLSIRPGWTANNLGSYPDNLAKPIPPKTILSWWDLNGQLGAPLLKDRLWLFTGFSGIHHEYRKDGYEGPGSTALHSSMAVAKVDLAPSNSIRLQGFVTRDASDEIGTNLSIWYPTPESTPDTITRTHAWNLRGTFVLSPNTVLEARSSGNTGTATLQPHPPATLDGPSPSSDAETGIACCNSFWRREARSTTLAGLSIDHERDGPGGRHSLKAGLEYEQAPADEAAQEPTGRSLTTLNGEIVQVGEWAGDHTHSTARQTVIFLEDRWAVNDRLTLEPGIRAEFNSGSVPSVSAPYRTSPVALRLGAAWDVTGRQSTVIRAHYGRYHDPLYGGVYQYTQPNAHSPHIVYKVVDGELVEQYRFTEEYPLPAPSRLKQSHVDQFVVGVEHALGPNTTVQVQYIARRFGNFIGWIDERLSDWTPLQVQDSGPDGVPGTADDGGLFTVYQVYGAGVDLSDRALELGNPTGAHRWYSALQFIATRRLAANWQYQVSYTWSRSRGNIGNDYHTNATYSDTNPFGYGADPGKQAAAPGPPRYDYSEFKALGSYRAPWLGGLTTSAVFRWHSGTTWTRIGRAFSPVFITFPAEPIGSRRTPSLGGLDWRVEKTFRLRSTTLGLYADVFNVTNVGRAVAYFPVSGPRFGDVTGWTDPRTARIGIRCSF